ncbi:hypothetical protein LLEC1_00102 [Akanthomyces lecanii]|uniref:Uncharacterized protein n=1 Tax=Cordyceps confragosa TaxID=2714763 RepID=A0A179IJB1_CORDF|nr:hypothetical protein LLEC1_00102 [Akanthomyces lecanii]
MTNQGDEANPTQRASRDKSTAGVDGKDGKGKERAAPFSDRLQASGRMVLNATAAAQPPLNGSDSGKASAGPASTNRSQSLISESTLSEASRSRSTPGLGRSLRNNPYTPSQASAGYEQFLNQALQLRDTFEPVDHKGRCLQSRSFQKQAASDGSNAVQVLSMPEEEPNYSESNELLSEQEAARLREAFFANGTSHSTWNHLLSFSPDFVLDPSSSHAARSHMGTDDTRVARAVWLQQWQDVLNSYTDEVWGDLGSLVEEAKSEIETSRAHIDTRSPESKALDRLRQILAHVRGQA